MSRLPVEILGIIFASLHQNDHFECMLVCNHWKQVLEKLILYRSAYIYSENSVNALLEKIKKDANIAGKVERLLFSYDPDYANNFCKLLSQLKNLKAVIRTNLDANIRFNNADTVFSFHKQIEYFSDRSSTLALAILSSGVCPRLTTLITCDLSDKVPHLLKNAPSLKTLSISSMSCSFADIDIIHENAPEITSIELLGLKIKSTGINMNTNPATTVMECIIRVNIDVLTDGRKVLEYISMKYPNLTSVICFFNYHNIGLGDSFTEQMKLGWISIIKKLGPQLKTIGSIRGDNNSDIFSALDQYGSELDYLKLEECTRSGLQNMIDSTQIHLLQKLDLFQVKFNSFDWLKSLQRLKKLIIFSSGIPKKQPTVDLNDFLCNCPPSLEEISFSGVALSNLLDFSDTPTNIKDLSFIQVKLPEGIDNFISRNLPKLSNLSISLCGLSGRIFSLLNTRLNTLCLYRIFFFKWLPYILISTTNTNEKRLYRPTNTYIDPVSIEKTNLILPSPVSIPFEGSNEKPHFTFICKSLNKLIVPEK